MRVAFLLGSVFYALALAASASGQSSPQTASDTSAKARLTPFVKGSPSSKAEPMRQPADEEESSATHAVRPDGTETVDVPQDRMINETAQRCAHGRSEKVEDHAVHAGANRDGSSKKEVK